MPAQHSPSWNDALRDTWPAIGLFVLGALFFFPSVWSRGGHPMWGILGGVALIPIAVTGFVLLLPVPRNLGIRFILAMTAGAAVSWMMVKVVTG